MNDLALALTMAPVTGDGAEDSACGSGRLAGPKSLRQPARHLAIDGGGAAQRATVLVGPGVRCRSR